MTGLAEVIPGLAEAERLDKEELLEAFAGIEEPICGIEVRPLTPRMYIDLDLVRNAFFAGGVPSIEDVCVFLWRISPDFHRDAVETKRRFTLRAAQIPYGEAVVQIHAYLNLAYSAAPEGSGKRRPFSSWPSVLVYRFAQSFGWSEAQVFDTPYRRLFQYLNRIIEGEDEDYQQHGKRSMRVRDEWLKKINQPA